MKLLGIVIAVTLLLAGCGGGSGEAAAKTAPETPSATATTEDVPRVSEATFCRIALAEGDSPFQDAASVVRKFANDPDPTELDRAELEDLKASLDSLGQRAPESLAPHVEAQSAMIQTLIDAAENPQDGQDISFETFKSSGLEVAVTCGG